MDVNELSLHAARLRISTGVNVLADEDMAASGTVADDATDLTYGLAGDLPSGLTALMPLTFNTDGTGSFDPGVLFDSSHTGDGHIVSFNYIPNEGAIKSSRAAPGVSLSGRAPQMLTCFHPHIRPALMKRHSRGSGNPVEKPGNNKF
jgi:hypothetical protein